MPPQRRSDCSGRRSFSFEDLYAINERDQDQAAASLSDRPKSSLIQKIEAWMAKAAENPDDVPDDCKIPSYHVLEEIRFQFHQFRPLSGTDQITKKCKLCRRRFSIQQKFQCIDCHSIYHKRCGVAAGRCIQRIAPQPVRWRVPFTVGIHDKMDEDELPCFSGMLRCVQIPMGEGEPLGATLSEKLVVTEVQSDTPAEGKLKVSSRKPTEPFQMGDQIIHMNGVNPANLDDFFRLLRFAPPLAELLIIRDDTSGKRHDDGFHHFVVRIEWKVDGPKLDLGLIHYENRVLVSRCDEGSLLAAQLAIGDHIVFVEGNSVAHKHVARDMLLKRIQHTGSVTMVVARPKSAHAKHWMLTALASSSQQPPSEIINSDVQAIFLEQSFGQQLRIGREVQEQCQLQEIASDVAHMTTPLEK